MVVLVMIITALFTILTALLFSKLIYDECYRLITSLLIKKVMEKQGVRGPKPRFLTGNSLAMASLISEATSQDMTSISHDIVGRLLPHHLLWTSQFGKRFLYWNGTDPILCLTETDLIQEFFLKCSKVSGKSWQQKQGTKHFIGEGLLMANGKGWYQQRHIVAHAFSVERLKRYSGLMVQCTKEMLQSLENAVERGESEVEIDQYMLKLAADIISRTVFGTSHGKGKKIFHLLKLLQSRCAQSSKILGSRFVPTKHNLQIRALKMEVESLLMEIIQSRKDSVETGRNSSYGNDMLGSLLNENRLNLQLVMDECKSIFFGGHETGGALLTWTIMLLASNPTWQDKVRSEIKSVCPEGIIPTMDQLSDLTKLHMVIDESMRLYPPTLLLPRMAFEDIELGCLHIPKGLSIWIPVLDIHHSKKLWGEDANEFNPGRFASNSFITAGCFLPFASGPRDCVGKEFALVEAKIILAMLISRFSFTISGNYRHAPVLDGLTIKPKHGLQICLN